MNNLKNFVETIENFDEFELKEMLENANIVEHLVDLFHIYVKHEGVEYDIDLFEGAVCISEEWDEYIEISDRLENWFIGELNGLVLVC